MECLTLSRSLSLSLSFSRALALFLSRSHTLTLSVSRSLSLALSRSRSLSPLSVLARGSEEQGFRLNRYYVASLILHDGIIAEITALILSLSYASLISSDDSSIISIFVQINLLEGRAGNIVLTSHVSVTIFISIHCLITETVKFINENASKYSMWHREAN